MDNSVNIGGDRLGSGKDMKVNLHGFNKSNHNLDYVWRSSMASGTLVPFMNLTGLPGDTFDIDLYNDVMTLPTIGPLFGSYKIQLDVFSVPYRLYNKKLFNNTLNIGMDMHSIKLPLIQYEYNNADFESMLREFNDDLNNLPNDAMINNSALVKYLGISGTSNNSLDNGSERYFNAVPLCAYWDIYKNYYANRQEDEGVCIYNKSRGAEILSSAVSFNNGLWTALDFPVNVDYGNNPKIRIEFENPNAIDLDSIVMTENASTVLLNDRFNNRTVQGNFVIYSNPLIGATRNVSIPTGSNTSSDINLISQQDPKPELLRFPLFNVDLFRDVVLSQGNDPLIVNNIKEVNGQAVSEFAPYNLVGRIPNNNENEKSPDRFTQNALGIKCYQSDLFNNWIDTDFIDGTTGVNAVASVDTSGGSFNLDQLNLANKVYNMLNRIAITGGSYDDYLKGAYGHDRKAGVYSPIYHGSLIKELAFQEVISNADTESNPLGTLAGRGKLTNKNKGGKIKIECHEHSVIMGIVSITPRVTYSQGNKWDMNLKTMGDFHNPNLDQIGYQDLITDQLSWLDTDYNGTLLFNSAGKQPSWINYMTEVDKSYGNFADPDKEMYMTLNRSYSDSGSRIDDLTTYIDPSKFNNIFADTRLDAQNFWCQIKCDIKARRKVSSKTIPNL